MNGDWLIQALCLMGSVVGIVFLVSMIRRDGAAGRGLYIFMGLAVGLIALVYFVADSRQKSEEIRKTVPAVDVKTRPSHGCPNSSARSAASLMATRSSCW